MRRKHESNRSRHRRVILRSLGEGEATEHEGKAKSHRRGRRQLGGNAQRRLDLEPRIKGAGFPKAGNLPRF